ncbi:MAG: FHA domain-containing protein [Anaerolineales bacterium]|jgi:hypothetical protein
MASQSFQLVTRIGPTPGEAFPLSKSEITLGRDANNDIVFDYVEVSRRHARLRMQAGGYVLEDLGSTNGTFVNEQRLIGPHSLRPGETISLGDAVTLIYEVAQYDPEATVVSTPIEMPPPQRQEQPAESQPSSYPQPSPKAPEPAPVYSGQVPAGPTAIEEKKGRPWLWAGVGCVVVLLCVVVAGAFIFDSLNLYCSAPFDLLFSFLYTCP